MLALVLSHEVARAEELPATDALPRNWFSLAFQQDFLSYQETTGVCSGAAQYQCFSEGASFSGPAYEASGNQLAAGIGLATQRILLGYERVLGDNFSLGGRFGVAFRGSPKATIGTAKAFLPIHLELRGSYWFGDAPLSRTGLHPFLGAALALAEVDGHVAVEYYADEAGYRAGESGTVDAWRQTGPLVIALHAGLAYALADRHALLLELRLLQMLDETAVGGAVQLGYAFAL